MWSGVDHLGMQGPKYGGHGNLTCTCGVGKGGRQKAWGKLGDIGGLMVTLSVICIGRSTLVSGSDMIGLAPKILIWRSFSFLDTGSGRVVGRWPSLVNRGRGSRRSRLRRRAILGRGSFAWLKNKMRILNTILRNGFRHLPK